MGSLIEARGVEKRFGTRAALRGVDVRLRPGEVVALAGPNGCGKSTLARVLAGLERADAGEVSMSIDRARVGVVLQRAAIDGLLTCAENLRLECGLSGMHGRDAEARVDRALLEAGLADRADDRASALSEGLRRRLDLARVMMRGADVLVMDEPTAGVDAASREALWARIAEATREGLGVLVATHDFDEAGRGDRLVLMRDGAVLAEGRADEMIDATGGWVIEVDAPTDGSGDREEPAAVPTRSAGTRRHIDDLIERARTSGASFVVRRATVRDVYEAVIEQGAAP